MLRVQLHVHTTASRGTRIKYDSTITPAEAIKILRKRGVDAVAVTDHNTTRAYDLMRRIGERKGVYVIRGIEIDTLDGHLIGLGVEGEIERRLHRRRKFLTASEAAELIRDFNGEVYIPHPFDIQHKGIGMKVSEVNGIVEVFNPMNIFGFEDEIARIVASKLGRPMAVGSDAHTESLLGCCINLVSSEPDVYSILRSLRKGEVRFEKCRYISIKELKEWVLRRMLFSQKSIKSKIDRGWEIDANYMVVANNPLMRKLEKLALELGIRSPSSPIWDFTALMAYSVAVIYAKKSEKEYRNQIINELQSAGKFQSKHALPD